MTDPNWLQPGTFYDNTTRFRSDAVPFEPYGQLCPICGAGVERIERWDGVPPVNLSFVEKCTNGHILAQG